MSLEMAKDLIRSLSPPEWEQLLGWVVTDEKTRRETAKAQESARTALIMHLREIGEIPQPDALKTAPRNVEDAPEWEHPKAEPQNCYCQGDIIQHDGKLWRSTYEYLNCAIPGESPLWEEINPAPTPIEEDVL